MLTLLSDAHFRFGELHLQFVALIWLLAVAKTAVRLKAAFFLKRKFRRHASHWHLYLWKFCIHRHRHICLCVCVHTVYIKVIYIFILVALTLIQNTQRPWTTGQSFSFCCFVHHQLCEDQKTFFFFFYIEVVFFCLNLSVCVSLIIRRPAPSFISLIAVKSWFPQD